MHALRTAAAAILIATLAGCGTQGMIVAPTGMQTVSTQLDAASTSGLTKAFTLIHKAIFNKMDANHDHWIDEYEAAPYMSLSDFQDADTAKGRSTDRLSYGEFMAWSTHKFLWFHDNANSFEQRFRSELGDVFQKLDENHDGLLEASELSTWHLERLHLTFEYPKLNINVPIKSISASDIQAADKTGDGKLSPAEFEDLYVTMVVNALSPAAPPAPPAPAPSAAPAGH